MKKTLCVFMIISCSFLPLKGYSFFGAGETIALAKILVENVKQLIELKKIVEAGEDTFKLLDDINRGINDALHLLETINKVSRPGTFYQIKDLSDLKNIISELYGTAPDSLNAPQLQVHDMTVAESFQMHNQLYDYAKKLDEAGESMKREANSASPGRAQKLSAQNQGAILQALSQLQRNQAQMIKLLAEDVAMKNQSEKKKAKGHMYKYESLKNGFSSTKINYRLPTVR